jgi:hypothetical protein
VAHEVRLAGRAGCRGPACGLATGLAGTRLGIAGAVAGRGAAGRPALLAGAVVAGGVVVGSGAGAVVGPAPYISVPVSWTVPGLSAMSCTVATWPAVSVSRTVNGPAPAPDDAIQ